MYQFTLPPPIPRENQILKGINQSAGILATMQQYKANEAKNKLLQAEIEKQQGTKAALAGFGKDSFDMRQAFEKLLPIDPEMALKIKDSMRKSTKEQLEMLSAGAELTEKYAPAMMNNPQAYVNYYQTMGNMGLAGSLPHPASFVNPETKQFDIEKYNNSLKQIVGMKDFIKSELEGPKAPTTREIEQGDRKVTQEWDKTTGQWRTVGEGPRWNPEAANGMRIIEHPDGTKEYVMGGRGGPQTMSGLPKKVESDIYEKLNNSLEVLGNINRVSQGLDKDLPTYGGQVKNLFNVIKEKAGFGLSEDQKAFTQRYTQFVGESKKLHSTILKALSGLAVTATEEARIKQFSIDPEKDSYTQAITKIKALQNDYQRIVSRTSYAVKNGLDLNRAPQDIDSVMIKFRDNYAQQLKTKQPNLPKEQADYLIRQAVAKEFNLLDSIKPPATNPARGGPALTPQTLPTAPTAPTQAQAPATPAPVPASQPLETGTDRTNGRRVGKFADGSIRYLD